jgi:putative aminopeptidase FrvX
LKSIAGSLDSLLPPLLEAYGPPGRETGIRTALRRALRGAGALSEDATGSLHVHRPGRGRRLGEGGLGRVALLGTRTPSEMVGATVRFDDGTAGMLGVERSRAAKDAAELEADQLFLETGLGAKGAAKRLRVGSVGALDGHPARLGDLWCSPALDNRAGCAALVAALRAAPAPRYDLHVVFTAQSELGARGALTGTFGVDPDLAVVVDVAHVGDSKEAGGIALGKGPCLGLKEEGYVAHQETLDLVKRAAAAARVKTQWLIRESEGSDARAVRASRLGVPTALVAIPARRTGGPASLVHAGDVAQTAQLVSKLMTTAPGAARGGRR